MTDSVLCGREQLLFSEQIASCREVGRAAVTCERQVFARLRDPEIYWVVGGEEQVTRCRVTAKKQQARQLLQEYRRS